MILGIGLDIINIARIEALLKKSGESFEKKVFSQVEIEKSQKFSIPELKSRYYAKRFAAKEAFSKAIGLGIGRGIDFIDISIINDENGKPIINLSSKAEIFLKKHFKNAVFQIDLSLTDEREIAQAIVIISKC